MRNAPNPDNPPTAFNAAPPAINAPRPNHPAALSPPLTSAPVPLMRPLPNNPVNDAPPLNTAPRPPRIFPSGLAMSRLPNAVSPSISKRLPSNPRFFSFSSPLLESLPVSSLPFSLASRLRFRSSNDPSRTPSPFQSR